MTFISGVDFVTVMVSDIERAKQFYGELLELPVGKDYGQHPGVEYETGSLTLQVMDPRGFGLPPASGPGSMVALHVDDFDGSVQKLRDRGVEFAQSMDSGVCHMAFFADPDGNPLCLHHRYAPPEARPDGF